MNKKLFFAIGILAVIALILYATSDEIYDKIIHLNVDIPSLTKAAEDGDVDAQATLGYYYCSGKCVKKDTAKGIEWYRKAAEQGEPTSQVALGIRYFNGYDVPQDKEEALNWFQKSADQGNPLAKEWLEKIKED